METTIFEHERQHLVHVLTQHMERESLAADTDDPVFRSEHLYNMRMDRAILQQLRGGCYD